MENIRKQLFFCLNTVYTVYCIQYRNGIVQVCLLFSVKNNTVCYV